MSKTVRKTFHFDEDTLEEFLNISHWGYGKKTTPINEALTDFIKKWKAKKENKMFLVGDSVKERPGIEKE